ncbi:MAG: hypothetical protein DCF17_17970 [Shackletoniella antarctica]|uniref:Uncharacterized protein n=1 Tax=Shackletoniella antarctica TaxID=268115 RepID=A0A2W4VVH1_9CYAN|nr:MAG: hypothetical protein DCF17_17970 [Shackletoniella antarctica]
MVGRTWGHRFSNAVTIPDIISLRTGIFGYGGRIGRLSCQWIVVALHIGRAFGLEKLIKPFATGIVGGKAVENTIFQAGGEGLVE